ncbi:MAG: VPLPA-CTERM sorting domain-containing protein [Pseudomonadota bacterium]
MSTRFPFNVVANGGNASFQNFGVQGSAQLDFNLVPGIGTNAIGIDDAGTPNNSDDAFDDALMVSVNGTLVTNADNAAEVLSGPAGTNVIFDPLVPVGLSAEQTFFAFDSDPLLREFFSLTNTGGSTVSIQIESASNLGSDADGVIQSDSSLDGTFDANDTFVVFDDPSDAGTGQSENDPDTLFVFHGAGAEVSPTTAGLFFTDDVNALFEFDLAPGETKSLLIFAGVFDEVIFQPIASQTLGTTLSGDLQALGAGGYLAGLSQAQVDSVVNYGGSFTVIPLPAGAWLLLSGLVGLAALRTRKSA